MNEDNGTLSFATAIDTSGFEEGARRMEEQVSAVTSNVEQESVRIKEAFTDFPTINIDFITNASQSLDTIDAAFEMIDSVVGENQTQVRELESEYQRLGQLAGKAFTSGADDEYRAIEQDRRAIKELINARKEAIQEAVKTSDELVKVEQKLKDEAAASVTTGGKTKTLRNQLMELTMQLAELEMQGKSNTQEFIDLQNKAAALQDQMGDTRTQIRTLANDEAGFAGMMSVMSGVSGGFTALTGAMSIFGSENEDLQKVMARLQGVMAMTMGLQQVSQMLNKDSAASLVVLNGLKQWWNKLLLVGAGAQQAENIAIAEGTAESVANATATAAQTSADRMQAAASAGAATAEVSQTAATAANTTAAVAGTAANITLAGAFRMVGAAIMSIPVFGWIAAGITALIAVITHLVSKSKEADEAFEEQQEMLKNARGEYAKASVEIDNYKNKIKSFNGTQQEEKKLVEELNSKYGKSMGYHKTLASWKDTLKKKGEAYCQMIMLEAQAQAVLNKYTDAYINLLEVKDKADKGEYDAWYRTKRGDENERNRRISEAEKEMNKWLSQYNQIQNKMQGIKDSNDLNDHVDTTKTSTASTSYDPKKAALERKKVIDAWKKSVKEFVKDANDEITSYSIERLAEGQEKELRQIELNVERQKRAWRDKLLGLAETMKNARKDVYMSKKGATETGWAESEDGKKTTEQYADEILSNPEFAKKYYAVVNQIVEQGEMESAAIRKKYTDSLVEQYGTTAQKLDKLNREWLAKLKVIPPEYLDQAIKQMEHEFSALETADFKNSINWDSVFGSLEKQSTDSIQFALGRVKEYFDGAKGSMSTEDIKMFSEAIKDMENEIASRNPFSAFAKSISDIAASKEELVAAINEMTTAQQELTLAQQEYNAAQAELQALQAEVDAGTLAEKSERYANAQERLGAAQKNLSTATEKSNKAEQKAMSARNNATSAYKNFSQQLKSVSGVVVGLGENAKNLASLFSSNVAKGIGKALDVVDSVMNAAGNCINALADTGKSVSSAMVQTANASGQAMQSTAAASATAISTVEKASIILAVISAALQVATAIAGLFNRDDELQEHIDGLQREIDTLQWQLDNIEAVEIEKKVGSAFENVTKIVQESQRAIIEMYYASEKYTSSWGLFWYYMSHQAEAYQKSVEKIADIYADLDYTSDKLLGAKKWESSRSQLENYAAQMVKINEQIADEESKKKTDQGQIEAWKEQMAEISAEMAAVINDMVEGIIGGSASDIASQLGDAFFEACMNGEDAMEAWASTAKDIIRDVVKQMLVSKLLEEPLGNIFDKYRKKWFGDDGTFAGIDAVIDSMNGFSSDLNAVGEGFSQIWESLPDSVTEWFSNDERSGTSKGIATASQESVDENNARLTTIQAHTYTLVQGVQELNATGNAILERLTGIEEHTQDSAESLADVRSQVRSMRNTLDDIQLKGIKIS